MGPRILNHIPDTHLDMFEKPLIPHLTTLLEDGSPRCSPLWCDFDGEFLRFTNETTHIVYQTVIKRPEVCVSIADPAVMMRYLEVRGVIEKIEPDPTASLLYSLGERMGCAFPKPLPTAADRVILYMRPTSTTSYNGFFEKN